MKFPFTKNVKSPKIVHSERFELPIHLYVERRRNSRISILKKNINIRLPTYLNEKTRKEEVDRLLSWAEKRISANKAKDIDHNSINYWKDRQIELFDGIWTLEYQQLKGLGKVVAQVNENNRYITFKGNFADKSEEDINSYSRELVIKIFKKYYYKIVLNLLTQINDKTLKESFNKLTLKYTSSRWGSCSVKRNINISIKLLLAPQAALEYVLLHELAHLKEMNHSSRYWKIVATHLPNYKEQEVWLKKNSRTCDF